jgi:hypothetical protein
MRKVPKRKGIPRRTIFKVPRSFDFFIKGAREVNIKFTKITNLALYRTLKKADSEFQSQSQLVKFTLQEVMGIIIEDHGVENIRLDISFHVFLGFGQI